MIKALWRFLFGGHDHKWNVIKSGKLIDSKNDNIGDYYHLQCEHCGKLSYHKFY